MDQQQNMMEQQSNKTKSIREYFSISNSSERENPLEPVRVWLRLVEWAIIFVIVFAYFSSYLSAPTDQFRLPGNEEPLIQSFGQIFTLNLQQGYFPLWNPYVSTGFPYFADPVQYIYNPFIILPMILFGYIKGFVYAVFIGMLVGAFGMWWLARQSGLGSAGRTWSALMFVLAGVLIIRFSQGQYLLVFGYGWLPWAIGAMLRVLRFGRLKDIGAAAIIFALLYLCGNLYFAYFLLYVGALATIIFSINFKRIKPFININLLPVRNLAISGALVFGLISVHILPLIEFSPRIVKGVNLELTDSHNLSQILLDYTSKDKFRPDAIQVLPPEDFYGYIGWYPFLAMLGLPFAWKRKHRSLLFLFTGIFIFSILWIDIREMPWRELYRSQPLLYQFRYPTRMLALGTLSLIFMGAFGLDGLWKRMLRFRRADAKSWQKLLAAAAMMILAVFMLISVGDLYNTNGSVTGPSNYDKAPDQILSALRTFDTGTYYISAPANWHEHTINYGMRYWDAWYPAGDMVEYKGMINQRGFVAGPKYRILGINDPVPDNSTPVINDGGFVIYRIDSSLPFSFSVPTETLMVNTGQPVQPADVIDQPAITQGPNQVEINVNDNDGTPSTLVVLTEGYPGWEISVDGKPAKLVNVSGYIGTPTQPGQHRYVFSFQPAIFLIGLFITILSLIILVVFLSDGRLLSSTHRNRLLQRIKSISRPVLPKPFKPTPEEDKEPQPQPISEGEPEQVDHETGDENMQIDTGQVTPEKGQVIVVDELSDGDVHIQVTLTMPVGTQVRLTVEALDGNGKTSGKSVILERQDSVSLPLKSFSSAVSTPSRTGKIPDREVKGSFLGSLAGRFNDAGSFLATILESSKQRFSQIFAGRKLTYGLVLFILGVGIYLFTRLYALQYFPIYFFGDEAVQTLYAERLISNHFTDANGMGIPIYVEAAANRWTPLISMYFQAITDLLFGKSILTTRATSAIISLLAAVSISLILKYIFNKRYWWAGILAAAVIPAWFLHSRTAFETVMSVSFYAAFLLFYLLYRYKDARYLYAALAFGALTFYSYSNAQAVMATAGLFLLISDIRYHWKNRMVVLYGLLFAVVLALPIINFEIRQPSAIGNHLQAVDSYWFKNASLMQKIGTFFTQYLYGLSPQYWVFPNTVDLSRHRMDGMGQISFWMLPLIVIGAIIAIRNIKESKYRTILLVMLATPIGGALVQTSITRVLTFIVPASILAVLGLEWIIDQIQKRWQKFPGAVLQTTVFLLLAGASLLMLRTALVDGPLWEKDYGLYGMQWGAKQLFVDSIPHYLESDPKTHIMISSTWANGTDNFLSFFINDKDRERVSMAGIQTYLSNYTPIGANDLFVLTSNEYKDAVASKKFSSIKVEQILNYPDGNPGFYFVRLVYVDGVEKMFVEEKKARLEPAVVQTVIDGQDVTVHLSQTDAGRLSDAMDGNLSSLMRGMEANPFFMQFDFSKPRTMSGFIGDFSAIDYKVTFDLYAPGSEIPIHYETEKRDIHDDVHLEIKFDKGPAEVQKIVINITNLNLPLNEANIHIREIKFLP